jgi:N-dimethylarginine dimethylaminohydrolase
LEAVALYRPRAADLRAIRSPRSVQHLGPLALPQLQGQLRALAQTYRRLGIDVLELSSLKQTAPPNLMFVRDLFFTTTEGCVVGRMASRVRAGEEKFAAAALASAAVPLRATIGGHGLFEGADALWLDPRTVLVGLGARTNRAGSVQLREILRQQGVRALPVVMPSGVQHLLGILQIVGPDLVVLRREKAPRALVALLRRRGFEIIDVDESDEIRLRQGMNFVCISERKIIMASGAPQLRAQLEAGGIRIVAELEISQLCQAAGGIACATGIVRRRLLK